MRLLHACGRSTLGFLLLAVFGNLAAADIFRWDTGALIPGLRISLPNPSPTLAVKVYRMPIFVPQISSTLAL